MERGDINVLCEYGNDAVCGLEVPFHWGTGWVLELFLQKKADVLMLKESYYVM